MEVGRFAWILVWCTIFMFPSAVVSAPVKVDFSACRISTYNLYNNSTESFQCCPPLPTKPIIDGPPPPSTKSLRVRKAAQCTDAAYAANLKKGYALMRALPDDDPRSFKKQWQLHCAYCGGAFLTTNSSGIPQGLDIHWGWLFFPWHRWYLFFHERILQFLLEDPTFSLNYWNWDNHFSVGDGSTRDGACLKQGDDFPVFYDDNSSALYFVNRSLNAKGEGRLFFPDLTVVPLSSIATPPHLNASAQEIIEANVNVMYQAMVSGGTTSETFMGRPYRGGDVAGTPLPNGGAGSLEGGPHAAVHRWLGPDNANLAFLGLSPMDPAFYAHHSNIDRLWQVWKDIGPLLGQNREDYSDPDFLNAEFLFYDENKDLRRVTIAQSLDSKTLGYVYQGANDASWIFPNTTKCSKLSYDELLAQAESLPSPIKDSKGYYHLQGGKTFIIVVDRPDNPKGLEEFLTIDGIKLDRSRDTGFDVFVDWLNPTESTVPCKCAEYSGRLTSLAQSRETRGKPDLVWKESVSRTLVDIDAPTNGSKVVVSIVPFYQSADSYATIKFKQIKVTDS